MQCDNCLLVEMTLDKVEDNSMYFKCRKCGKEVKKTVENLNSNSN